MTFVHPTRIAGAPRNFIPVRPATLADSLPVGAGQEVGSVAQEAVVAVVQEVVVAVVQEEVVEAGIGAVKL
jgi:hypothetical protein